MTEAACMRGEIERESGKDGWTGKPVREGGRGGGGLWKPRKCM